MRQINIETLCAQKGLRITGQRRVIAQVLSEAEDHPDVESLYERASAIDSGISIATVYRTVRYLKKPVFLSVMILAMAARVTRLPPKIITTIL